MLESFNAVEGQKIENNVICNGFVSKGSVGARNCFAKYDICDCLYKVVVVAPSLRY